MKPFSVSIYIYIYLRLSNGCYFHFCQPAAVLFSTLQYFALPHRLFQACSRTHARTQECVNSKDRQTLSAHHPYYSVNRVKGHCPVKNTLRLQARRTRSQTDAHYASQHVVEVHGFSPSPAHSSLGRRGNIPRKPQTRNDLLWHRLSSSVRCHLWRVDKHT